MKQTDKTIIDDAIHNLKIQRKQVNHITVIHQLNKDMRGFVGQNKKEIISYVNGRNK